MSTQSILSLVKSMLKQKASTDDSFLASSKTDDSIVLDGALSDLLKNLHKIPAEELQSFADKYAI